MVQSERLHRQVGRDRAPRPLGDLSRRPRAAEGTREELAAVGYGESGWACACCRDMDPPLRLADLPAGGAVGKHEGFEVEGPTDLVQGAMGVLEEAV